MKTIITFTVLCLALTNAFYLFPVSTQDAQTLATQSADVTAANFNEIDALQGFITGLLSGAGKVTASDSLLCIKGDGPISLFEYYYGLALAAGTSGQTTAAESARQYLATVGARHISKLPADFVQCLANSQDFQAVSTNWGISYTDAKFGAAFSAIASANPAFFQNVFSEIYSAMTKGNFHVAGYLFGTYARNAGFKAARS